MAAAQERYSAFLSYDRRDNALCDDVHLALESLGRPFFRLRARRVFRYTANLPADGSLPDALKAALASSDYFVLLATPHSAQNKWVGFEIRAWLDAHGQRPAKLLLVFGDGATAEWDDVRQDFNWNRTNAIHPALNGKFATEPRYVDLGSTEANGKRRTIRNPEFRERIAEIAAPLDGCNKEELVGRYVSLRRRLRATALLTAATVGLTSWLVIGELGKGQARTDAAIAEARAQRRSLLQNISLPPDLDALQPQMRRLSIQNKRLPTVEWLTAPLEAFESGEPFAVTGEILQRLPATLTSLRIVLEPPFTPVDFTRLPFSQTLTELAVELRPGETEDCCAGLRSLPQDRVTALMIRFPSGDVIVDRLSAFHRVRQLTIDAKTIDLRGVERLGSVTDLSLRGSKIVNAQKLTTLDRLKNLEIDGSVDSLTSPVSAEAITIRSSVDAADSLPAVLDQLTASKAVGIILRWEPLNIDPYDVSADIERKLPRVLADSKQASSAAAEFLARHKHVERLAVAIDSDQLPNLAVFRALRVFRLYDIRAYDKEGSPLKDEPLSSLRVLAGGHQVETLEVRRPVASFDGLELFDNLTDLRLDEPDPKLALPALPRLRRLTIPKLSRDAAARVAALEELALTEPGDLEWTTFKSLKSLGLSTWKGTLGPAHAQLRELRFGPAPEASPVR